MNKIYIEPELLESLHWGNGYPLFTIANIFGCGESTIRRRMMEYGYPCRGVTDFTFSDRQKEIFEGVMLGDGGLLWQTNNCRFHNGDIHEEYLTWLQKQLGVEDISRIAPTYNSDFNDIIDGYTLTTRVIPSIRPEHKRWYPYEARRGTHQNRNNKIIPNDIEITPIKMLFWYIGDGWYQKDRNVAWFSNSLVFEDWDILAKKICKVLDVDSGISISKHHKDKDDIQIYNLRLNKIATSKFFDMVDSLGFDIPKCYHYKFGK